MSVVLSRRDAPLASISTLDRMGMALRRSTTLWTWASERRRAERSMEIFMGC